MTNISHIQAKGPRELSSHGDDNLVEILRKHAGQRPDSTALTFLKDGEVEDGWLTFGQIDRQARAIATQVQKVAEPGERALLLYEPGLEFVIAFFGCLYAGVIAVPAYPPRANSLHYKRLESVVIDAQATLVFNHSQSNERIATWKQSSDALGDLKVIVTDLCDTEFADKWQSPTITHDTLAFIQYTSGSTGDPKGVLVSHGNLLTNEQRICQGFAHNENSVVVGWLPLYHDMGLIGNLLQPIYLGSHGVLMSPQAFLQKPLRWLQAVSKYKAHTSGGPNFAYDLCMRNITAEQIQSLDLSHWQVAFNGSEVVRAQTIKKFSKTFAPAGFNAKAFYPCYGMAESTLFATGSHFDKPPLTGYFDAEAIRKNQVVLCEPDDDSEQVLHLASSGVPILEDEIVIVDPHTGNSCQPGQIGEILFNGPGVCQGYWQKPQLSEQTFKATVADRPGKQFLRTGDLGFVYQQELFITGRLKELVIIRGRNHYPQDIEKTIQQSVEGLVQGGGAAFAIEWQNEERLVLIQEVQRTYLRKLDPSEVFKAARRAVSAGHELQLHDLVLIKPSRIPKTSSGKIKRKDCHDRYLSHNMDDLAEIARLTHSSTPMQNAAVKGVTGTHAPKANIEAAAASSMLNILKFLTGAERTKAIKGYLRATLASLLKCHVDDIGVDEPVSGLGIDSLTATEFMQQVDSDLGVTLDLESVLDGATIRSLADFAAAGFADSPSEANGPGNYPVNELTDVMNDEIPSLAPPTMALNQQALWFLYQLAPQSSAYNLGMPVRFNQAIDIKLVADVMAQLVKRHPVLTSQFKVDEKGIVACHHGDHAISVSVNEAQGFSEDALQAAVQASINKPFDLSGADVVRVVIFNVAADEHILVLATHHIISDLWSLQLLLKDFCACYAAALSRTKPVMEAVNACYEDFVAWQQHWLASEPGHKARQYWLNNLSDLPTVLNLPLDRKRPHVQSHRADSHKFTLPSLLSQALASFAKTQGTTPFVILLSAFQLTMKLFSGQQDICTGVPASGRAKAEFSNLMGYFVSPMAIRNKLDRKSTLAQCVRQTKQTVLAALPHQHFPLHGIMDELCPVRDPSINPLYQTWFQFEQLRQLENAAPLLLGDEARIEVNGLQLSSFAVDEPGAKLDLALTLVDLGDQLSGRWVYSADLFDLSTVKAIHNAFVQLVTAIIETPDQCLGELDLCRDGIMHGPVRRLEGKLFHQMFEQRVAATPSDIAVAYNDRELSYQQLNHRSNQVAHYLISQGVKSESRIAVCLPRSEQLIAVQMAVLKVGAAYIPLDPAYPRERISFIVKDANVDMVLTCDDVVVLDKAINVVDLDTMAWAIEKQPVDNPDVVMSVNNLAYLIYTSGSTGQPKGVMISHANIENFFAGMDHALGEDKTSGQKAWLAVTSSAFDISMLELFWSLSRGYKVVVQPEKNFAPVAGTSEEHDSEIDFSLFYFADDVSSSEHDCYKLMMDSAQFADKNGFQSVWLPERHFHSFGGQYANPAVAAAAVAAVTKNIQIRAGSVVVPLHDPIRIAEEWAMVDNLSSGRVGISITPGWNPNDFILAPDDFANRHEQMYKSVETIQHLWQGKSLTRVNGEGKEFSYSTFPRPRQDTLPIWVTAAGHPDTFRSAGTMGANLLTHMLGQNITELKEKIDLYRKARADAGFDPKTGHVTLMMHTFVTDDVNYAMDMVELPFKSYLRSSVGLMKPLAQKLGIDFTSQQDLLVEQGFQRYATTSALFGTPESCLELVSKVKSIGVNEIACLIDFGIAPDETVDNLRYLAQLRKIARPGKADTAAHGLVSATDLIAHHNIKHLQCTPSFARMLLQQSQQQGQRIKLDKILIGGEAFPADLAQLLKQEPIDAIYNMYGPTETTIWSSVARLDKLPGELITLGTPIDNTSLYILNESLKPVPYNVEGELYISGLGLARGYWQRPDLTAERFVPDPFACTAGQPGAVMYRTGDIVKLTPGGGLIYQSRCDDQVKINGFRIELGEIETVIGDHDKVAQAVVLAEKLPSGESRLKTYLVITESVTLSEIQQHAAQRLPDYMVPARLEVIDTMPLTPNGKVDRKALKNVTGSALATIESEMIYPETQLEKKLADIWMELLQLDSISIHCNFFALGGHSLLATRLVSMLQEHAMVALTLQDIFVNPSIAKLTDLIESKGSELLQLKDVQLVSQIVPDKANRFEPFPLTEVQQAYWLGRSDSFELGNISTHIYFEFKLGHVDVDMLGGAWQKLIERHDMLRAVFLDSGEQQVLSKTPQYVLALQDHRGENEAESLAQVREALSHQVMDTAVWPLFEIRISRCENHDILHISMEVLIADGLSTVKLFKEWSQLYHDPDLVLPEFELSFRDCVLAERQLSETSQYQGAKQYWLERLGDIAPAPDLPLAKTPGSLNKPHFVRRSFHLQKDQWEQLQAKAQTHALTPSGILIGAFAEVLSLWSKSPRFTINLTLFNRLPLHPQVDELVGDFTSLTLLGVDNSKSAPFVERALAIQQELWQDLDHRLFNGVEVLRELAKQHGKASAAMPVVFTSALGLGSVEGDGDGIENLGEFVYGISQTPQVWLDHQVMEYQGGLLFNWDAVEELFPQDLLQSMFDAYVGFLEDLVTDDNEPGSAWLQPNPSAMMPGAQQTLLSGVNQTGQPQSDAYLQTLLTGQVAKTPDNIALITPSIQLTYSQVYQYALQVTAQLEKTGVKPGDIVAVSMYKGWEQVVAVYAILYAGAVYVPIDPDLPEQRISYLLEQTAAAGVLIQSANAGQGIWPQQYNILEVDQIVSDGAATLTAPAPRCELTDLAYIIFTSGSTGVPKGVMIDHLGAVNTVLDINQRFNVVEQDRVLALSSLSFDLSVYDIFGILAVGAALVLPDPDGVKEPAHWLDMVQQHDITVWNTVPALMQMLVEHIDGDKARGQSLLRVALLSGDWLPLKLPIAMKDLWPGIKTNSLGGATEASIWSICYPVTEPETITRCIPYGKPMVNQTFYVFNAYHQNSPVWVTGELHIGGIGLAKGYYKDQQKTDAAFITHPTTGDRLYRTGDMGRYLPDGNIEFLGREDSQVKINGFRVELGEIERVIQQYPDVKEAVVVTYGKRSEQQLAAYFTLESVNDMDNAAQQWFAEFTPAQLVGVLTDPIERASFKLHCHGVRDCAEQVKAGHKVIALEPAHDLVDRVEYLSRQSYREYSEKSLQSETFCRLLACIHQHRDGDIGNSVDIYLWLKEGKVDGLPGGGYRYDAGKNMLSQLPLKDRVQSGWFGPNKVLFERAGFALFMLGTANDKHYLAAGMLSQLLMQFSPELNIGLCGMGRITGDLNTVYPVAGDSQILHSMIGGRIEGLQRETWMDEPASPVERISRFIAAKLPSYMVPGSMMTLGEMPLTDNGKVNRKALPDPQEHDLASSVYVAPTNEIETQLATVFATLLGLEKVGIHDNFFDIGGNSLTAAQLNSKIREAFEVELSLRTIFEQTTVAELGATISVHQQAAQNLDVSDTLDDDMQRMEF